MAGSADPDLDLLRLRVLALGMRSFSTPWFNSR